MNDLPSSVKTAGLIATGFVMLLIFAGNYFGIQVNWSISILFMLLIFIFIIFKSNIKRFFQKEKQDSNDGGVKKW